MTRPITPMLRLDLTVLVGNIRQNPRMPQPDVEHDITALAGLAPDTRGLVVVGTEIKPRRYKRAWRRIMRSSAGLRSWLLATGETPVSTALPVSRALRDRLHRGVARVTPARSNAIVQLATPVRVDVIGKHTVSGAWRKGANARRTTRIDLRRHLWLVDTRLTAARVRRRRRRGVSTLIVGDLNTLHAPSYHPDQVVLAHHGLMWALLVPAAGVHVHLGQDLEIPESLLNTDHPVIGRALTLIQETR